MHLLIVGGSDAGISAALRAHELDPGSEVTLTGLASLPQRMGLRDGGFVSCLPHAIVCLFGGGGATVVVRASLRTLARLVVLGA